MLCGLQKILKFSSEYISIPNLCYEQCYHSVLEKRVQTLSLSLWAKKKRKKKRKIPELIVELNSRNSFFVSFCFVSPQSLSNLSLPRLSLQQLLSSTHSQALFTTRSESVLFSGAFSFSDWINSVTQSYGEPPNHQVFFFKSIKLWTETSIKNS